MHVLICDFTLFIVQRFENSLSKVFLFKCASLMIFVPLSTKISTKPLNPNHKFIKVILETLLGM